MAISYAGVSLILEDPDREYQQWLERALSLKDINWFGPEPLHYREGRDRPRGNHKSRVGLAVPNWKHRPPRWKLSTLWWPCTGAARFAQGLFLASDTQLSTILSSLDADGAAILEITDEQEVTMPPGSEILCVQMQGGELPCMWAKVDQDTTEREFFYEIQHPLAERLDEHLFDCELTKFLNGLAGSPQPPGFYRVNGAGTDWFWEFLKPY